MEKCDFWDFERLNFLWPKKVSFVSRTLLNISPFGKMRFLGLKKIEFFTAEKVFFVSRTLLNIISSLILTENNSRKKYIFWPKAWVNHFEKMRFFEKFCFLWWIISTECKFCKFSFNFSSNLLRIVSIFFFNIVSSIFLYIGVVFLRC